MSSNILRHTTRFIFLVLLQVLILNNIQFSGLINPNLYLLFILLLPFETPKQLGLILAFILGLTVDMFSDTGGLHTLASVFLAFIRPTIIKQFGPNDGYPFGSKPTLQIMGAEWFLKYVITLTFLHHIVLFYAEALSFKFFFFTLLKVTSSSIFTVLLIYIHQLFSTKTKKI